MRPEDMVTLSFYKELSSYKDDGSVSLIQHVDTKRLYVKKETSIYNKQLYLSLQQSAIPGTPKIHHVIDKDNSNIIVIEDFINGETLEVLLNKDFIFSETDSIQMILQLCGILQKLHKSTPPIIHRDIKPSNIIVTDDLKVTLIDFDASKVYDASKKQDTVLMGTVDYAAPEQFGFRQSDARTDIYALGILLNKLLTGSLPKDNLYTGKLSKIITKCIHMDPNERYQTANHLSNALLKFIDIQAINDQPLKEAALNKSSWFPPGFRTKKPWKMVLAVFGYIAIFWFAVISDYSEVTTDTTEILINKIAIVVCGFSWVAIFANYRNFAGRLPLSKSSNPAIKYIGCVIWCFVSLIIYFMLTDIAVTLWYNIIK